MPRQLSFWIHWRTLIEVLADFSFIVIVIVTAVKWVGAGLPVDLKLVLGYALLLSLIMLPINAWLGLYQRIHYRTLYDSRARAVLSLHLAIPIAALAFAVLQITDVSREFLEIAAMIGLFGVLTNRVRMAHARNRPIPRDRVLVYGIGERAAMVKEALDKQDDLVEIVGFFPSPAERVAKVPEGKVTPRDGALMDVCHR